jgi:hypothetical protein
MIAKPLQILVEHAPFPGQPMPSTRHRQGLSANQANVLAKWNARFALNLILPARPAAGVKKVRLSNPAPTLSKHKASNRLRGT